MRLDGQRKHPASKALPKKRPTASELFDKKWRPDKSGCHIWTASKMKNGYGKFGNGFGRSPLLAHRFAYARRYGEIPHGMVVMHKCDTPACVNPDHLVLGTQADNVADMLAKRRNARGERRWNAIATEKIVVKVRTSRGLTRRQLAEKYNISYDVVSQIIRRDTWKHIP